MSQIPYMMELLSIAHRMTAHGIRVDMDARERLAEQYQARLQDLLSRFTVNPYSPVQLLEFMRQELGLSKVRSTDERTLRELSDRLQFESHSEARLAFIDSLLEFREVSTLLSRYLGRGKPRKNQRELIGPDGYLHPEFDPSGTETLRWSCKNPNLQNVPPALRVFLAASPSCSLVCADLEQAEFRIIAYQAGERALIDAFEDGKDVHSIMTIATFPELFHGVSWQDPAWSLTGTAHYEHRRIRKTLTYLRNYGGGPETLAANLRKIGKRVSRSEAAALIERDKQAYPGISRLESRAEQSLARSRRQRMPTGQTRTFYGRSGAALIREFINWGCQGTVAWHVNCACIEVDRALRRRGAKAALNIQCHDELGADTAQGLESDVASLLTAALTRPVLVESPTGPVRIVIPAAAKSGPNWASLDKIGGT